MTTLPVDSKLIEFVQLYGDPEDVEVTALTICATTGVEVRWTRSELGALDRTMVVRYEALLDAIEVLE